MEHFKVTEQTDQIYNMLAIQGATLAKIYERIHNYQPMSWLLISSNEFVSNKRIDALKKWAEKQSLEFIEKRRIDTNLFISLAICMFIMKNRGKKISKKIYEAMSLIIRQLEENKRLRTPEMVGNILFFLSKSDKFKKQTASLKVYLTNELAEAIKAKNCATVIDCCFGLSPLEEDFDLHIFEECLRDKRLLNIDRIAKALIILAPYTTNLKENYFSYLRDKLEDEYFSKLSGILQALISGISLVESDLPAEEIQRAFRELKENEWTNAIEIEDKKIRLKKLSPSFLRALNSKSIGLCLLSMETANKKTKVSLYPDDFEKFRNAWKEKKFGFGVNKKQLHYLHYFSLLFSLSILFIGLWLSNFYEIIWNDIIYIVLMGFEMRYLVSISFYSMIIVLILGIIITYHRAFRRIVQSGEITGFGEVLLMIPIFGWVIKKIRGEEN